MQLFAGLTTCAVLGLCAQFVFHVGAPNIPGTACIGVDVALFGCCLVPLVP